MVMILLDNIIHGDIGEDIFQKKCVGDGGYPAPTTKYLHNSAIENLPVAVSRFYRDNINSRI